MNAASAFRLVLLIVRSVCHDETAPDSTQPLASESWTSSSFVEFDLFRAIAPQRIRAIIDVLTPPFAILCLVMLIWKGYDAAMVSLELSQATQTAFSSAIDLNTVAIPLSSCLVLLLILYYCARALHSRPAIAAKREDSL